MRYHYYPGCSLEGTALEYDRSTRAVLAALGVELAEIEDWTCCGASAAEAISGLMALVLPARNLALAERQPAQMDILVPCSACYLNRTRRRSPQESAAGLKVNTVLGEQQLHLRGRLRPGICWTLHRRSEAIRPKVVHPLAGLRIAPYYGCQCLRPYADFDDPELPVSMERLIRATGAEVFPWTVGGRCCGASHMSTQRVVGLELVAGILEAAGGADAVVTVCPMCQMNLEAFQSAPAVASAHCASTSPYLPQLIGSLGLRKTGLTCNLAVSGDWKSRVRDRFGNPAAADGARAGNWERKRIWRCRCMPENPCRSSGSFNGATAWGSD
jgi:heterodisulfide reductase subunit B